MWALKQPVWLWFSLSAKPTSPSSPSEKFPGAVAGINSPEAGRDLGAFGEGRTRASWVGSELGPPRPRRQRPVIWPLGPGRSFHSILIAVSNLRAVAQEGTQSGACCSGCLSLLGSGPLQKVLSWGPRGSRIVPHPFRAGTKGTGRWCGTWRGGVADLDAASLLGGPGVKAQETQWGQRLAVR